MAAYAVDAAMLVVAHDYLGLAFHAFVLLVIYVDSLQLSIVKPDLQI